MLKCTAKTADLKSSVSPLPGVYFGAAGRVGAGFTALFELAAGALAVGGVAVAAGVLLPVERLLAAGRLAAAGILTAAEVLGLAGRLVGGVIVTAGGAAGA